MGLGFALEKVMPVDVYTGGITHNLCEMARQAGVYHELWYPEESGIKTASQLIPILSKAIDSLRLRPDFYRRFEAKNGWGTYDNFCECIANLYAACIDNPDATFKSDR